MKVRFKRLICILLILLTTTCFNIRVNANYINPNLPKASDYIASCYMNISAITNDSLSISTTVTSVYVVDKISVHIKLQKKINNSTWVDICDWNYVKNNSHVLNADEVFNNASSGDYRFYEVYSVTYNGKTEERTAYSNVTTIY